MTTTTEITKYDQVSRSFGRCCQADGFFDTFYGILRASHPEIQRMFAGTDFKRQNELVRVALEIMLLYDHGNDAAKQIVSDIRKSHGRGRLNIKPAFYDLWLDALMQACAKHDAEFDAELETAWREVLAKSVDFIKAGYEEGPGETDCMAYLRWIDRDLEMVARAWRGLPQSARDEVLAAVRAASPAAES